MRNYNLLTLHDTQKTKTNYANSTSYMNDREFMWAGPQLLTIDSEINRRRKSEGNVLLR